MKIQHNPNPRWHMDKPSATLDDRYAAEVETATNRLSKRYEAAERRLKTAQEKLDTISTRKSSSNRKSEIRRLERIVRDRIAELEELKRLMEETSANSEQRGRKSFRPVPRP